MAACNDCATDCVLRVWVCHKTNKRGSCYGRRRSPHQIHSHRRINEHPNTPPNRPYQPRLQIFTMFSGAPTPATPREAELEAKLKQRDEELKKLQEQVAQLTEALSQSATPRSAFGSSSAARSSSPFAGMRPGGLPGGGAAASAARANSPRGARAASPRPNSPRQARLLPARGGTNSGQQAAPRLARRSRRRARRRARRSTRRCVAGR